MNKYTKLYVAGFSVILGCSLPEIALADKSEDTLADEALLYVTSEANSSKNIITKCLVNAEGFIDKGCNNPVPESIKFNQIGHGVATHNNNSNLAVVDYGDKVIKDCSLNLDTDNINDLGSLTKCQVVATSPDIKNGWLTISKISDTEERAYLTQGEDGDVVLAYKILLTPGQDPVWQQIDAAPLGLKKGVNGIFAYNNILGVTSQINGGAFLGNSVLNTYALDNTGKIDKSLVSDKIWKGRKTFDAIAIPSDKADINYNKVYMAAERKGPDDEGYIYSGSLYANGNVLPSLTEGNNYKHLEDNKHPRSLAYSNNKLFVSGDKKVDICLLDQNSEPILKTNGKLDCNFYTTEGFGNVSGLAAIPVQ